MGSGAPSEGHDDSFGENPIPPRVGSTGHFSVPGLVSDPSSGRESQWILLANPDQATSRTKRDVRDAARGTLPSQSEIRWT